MKPPTLSPRTRISEILALSPQVVRLFVEKRLGCAGCAMAAYCDLEDACKAYDLAMRKLMDEIMAACQGDLEEPGPLLPPADQAPWPHPPKA